MLELTLDFNQTKFAPGEPINGVVRLRNVGPEPIPVNGRLAINTPYAPEEMRDIAFTVSGPAGANLDFQIKVNVGEPAESDFKTLQPGEVIEKRYDLARYYELVQPGTYSVRAEYQNQAESQPRHGPPAWRGSLESPVRQFIIGA